MRDSSIVTAFERMEKMVGHDIRLLNSTAAKLALRVDAIQRVLFGSRLALPWAILLGLISPKSMLRYIDTVHKAIEAEYTAKAKAKMEAAAKAVINPNEVTNPRTIEKQGIQSAGPMLVSALVLGFISFGCVPKSQIQRSFNDGYAKANLECVVIQSQLQNQTNQVIMDLAVKNERLRMFNQINKDGSLRYADEPKAQVKPKPSAVNVTEMPGVASPSPKPTEKK